MKNKQQYTCRTCQGQLMPLWKNNNWFCIECKLEQSLPKEKKLVDIWDK